VNLNDEGCMRSTL